MKYFLALALALIVGNANATTLLGVEVFENGVLQESITGVSGSTIQQSGMTNFFSFNFTVTGDKFGNLSLNLTTTSTDFMMGTNNFTILASEWNIAPALATLPFDSTFNVTLPFAAGNKVTVGNFIDTGNTPFAKTLAISPTFQFFGPTGGGFAHQSESLVAQFAETIMMAVDSGPKDTVTGQAIIAGVPEPSTWLMMLAGFLGLGLFFSRRGSRLAKLAA